MSEHLTRQSPSWRNWFLSKLGWTDLPIPVTCWYCNQKMYLLPGSRHTERLWYCNLCENINAIDEFGDIMDAPPLPDTGTYSAYGLSLAQRKKSQQSPGSLARSSSQRTLCNNCQRNQTLIYQIMSDYIRDENDPDYEYYVKTADDYQQSLHDKYPLCDTCQEKIQVIVAEQKGNFRRRMINEQRQRSLQSKTPTRLTSFQYQFRGFLWFILHSSILFLGVFVTYYPPQPLIYNITTVPDIKEWISQASHTIFYAVNDDQHTVISLMSPTSTNQSPHLRTYLDVLIMIFWYIVDDFKDMIFFIVHGSHLILSSSSYATVQETPSAEGQFYSWNVTNMGIICYLLFYGSSFYFMNWHIRASRTFLELSKPRHLKTYRIVQQFLYIYRFIFLYSLAFMNTMKKSSLWITFASSYILLLTWSVLNVRLKKSRSSEWPEKIVGKSDKTQQDHHLEPMKPSRSSYLSPTLSSQSKEPSLPTRTTVPNHRGETKTAWYHPSSFMFKQQHVESRDAEVDGLTAELGRISV